jgi:hypothetical protein
LTALQIHQLTGYYNDTFDIGAGNTLDEQVAKFQGFITGVWSLKEGDISLRATCNLFAGPELWTLSAL